MKRRQFLGVSGGAMLTLVAGQGVAATTSSPGEVQHEVTLIATPTSMAAARRAIEMVFASRWLPDGLLVRLRSWWPAPSADCSGMTHDLPKEMRLDSAADWAERLRGYAVIVLDHAADPFGKGAVDLLRARAIPFTLLRCGSVDNVDTMHAVHTVGGRRRAGYRYVEVPSLWYAQLERQFNAVRQDADGSSALEDVERAGHTAREIFAREQMLLAELTAAAIARAAIDQLIRGKLATITCEYLGARLEATHVQI